MSALERRARGLTGEAVAFATRVELRREGPLSHLGDGVPDRTVVPFAELRAVVFEPAGRIGTGYVRFLRASSEVNRALPSRRERSRARDSVLFTPAQEAAFAALRDDVRHRLLERPRDAAEQRHRRRVLDGESSETQYRLELERSA